MKLYLIKFANTDYEQFDAFVVVAQSRKKLMECLHKKYDGSDNVDFRGYLIKEIKINALKRAKVLLGSFNPG